MAECDPQELMSQAGCFACLSPSEKQTLVLQLLCEIASNPPPVGGVTSIIAGDGISVDQATGDVTVTASNLSPYVDFWYSASTTVVATTNGLPVDDTIPQITEGAELISVSVTPNSASNKLKITVSGWFSTNAIGNIGLAVFVGSAANAVAAQPFRVAAAGIIVPVSFTCVIDSFSGTEVISLRGGMVGASFRWLALNIGLDTFFGGVDPAVITVEEIEP
jgi:hypothetical protein